MSKFLLFIKNNISYINLASSLTALTFQITILYPWHQELDKNFKLLNNNFKNVIDIIDKSNKENNIKSKNIINENRLNKHLYTEYGNINNNDTNKNKKVFYKEY